MRAVAALLTLIALLLPSGAGAQSARDAMPVEYYPTIACRSLERMTEVFELAKLDRSRAKQRFAELTNRQRPGGATCSYGRIGKVRSFSVVKSYEFDEAVLDHTLEVKVVRATYRDKRVRYITIERLVFAGRRV